MDACNPTNSVSAVKDTGKTDSKDEKSPYGWPYSVLSSFFAHDSVYVWRNAQVSGWFLSYLII